MLHAFGHRVAMCCDMLGVVGSVLKIQIWANNTQHVATHCSTVAKCTQHVAPSNAAICCVGMLWSFGQGFILDSLFSRPGSAPIGGGKKGEFRDWTRSAWDIYWTLADISVCAVDITSRSKKSNRAHESHTEMVFYFLLRLFFCLSFFFWLFFLYIVTLNFVKYKVKILKPQRNDHNMPRQHIATLLGATCCMRLATLLRHVVMCWVLVVGHFQTWANNTQHIATHHNGWPNVCNMLHPTKLWYVALACCDRLAGAWDSKMERNVWSSIGISRGVGES